jgi:hypothetical protein
MVATLSDSSAGPYMPDMPMQPSPAWTSFARSGPFSLVISFISGTVFQF